MSKKLYRSNDSVMLAGVLAGIGEYFRMDPTIVRLIFIVICIMTAWVPMTIVYIAASVIIPKSDVYNS